MVLQISTCRQGAIGIVYTYPLTNRNFEICEALATLKGEPSVQELLEDTSVSDAQHVANWDQVVMYTKTVKPEQIPFYNRFMDRPDADSCWAVEPEEHANLQASLAEEEQLEAHLTVPWKSI